MTIFWYFPATKWSCQYETRKQHLFERGLIVLKFTIRIKALASVKILYLFIYLFQVPVRGYALKYCVCKNFSLAKAEEGLNLLLLRLHTYRPCLAEQRDHQTSASFVH